MFYSVWISTYCETDPLMRFAEVHREDTSRVLTFTVFYVDSHCQDSAYVSEREFDDIWQSATFWQGATFFDSATGATVKRIDEYYTDKRLDCVIDFILRACCVKAPSSVEFVKDTIAAWCYKSVDDKQKCGVGFTEEFLRTVPSHFGSF